MNGAKEYLFETSLGWLFFPYPIFFARILRVDQFQKGFDVKYIWIRTETTLNSLGSQEPFTPFWSIRACWSLEMMRMKLADYQCLYPVGFYWLQNLAVYHSDVENIQLNLQYTFYKFSPLVTSLNRGNYNKNSYWSI